MSREAVLVLTIALALALLALLAWSWRRRVRRDASLAAPVGEPPAGAAVLASFPSLYVATTRGGEPLERLAIRGLGFRSRADVIVTDAGVVLDLPGQPRFFLAAARLVDAAQATVAIDRVVEADGLTRIGWRLDGDTVVDTYLRPQETSARALADAIRPLTSTGTDA